MPDIACINGEFCDLADARVPIEDRGYQFADGVYEVIVTTNGVPFLMREHLDRLVASLAGINMPVDLDELKIEKLIESGIKRCGYPDVMVYLQITRGVASRNHAIPDRISPTVVMTFKTRPVYDDDMRRNGVSLKSMQDNRWAHCNIKSIALLPGILLKNQARAEGYFDALIVSDAQVVRESTAANVFIVKDGTLRTPPRSNRILPGITRGFVLESAAKLGIPIDETDFDLSTLFSADEIFITSTTMDVMPVSRIDAKTIGNGTVGEVTERLSACFNTGATSPA